MFTSVRCDCGKESGVRDAETDFLAFHVSAGLKSACRLIHSGKLRIPSRFCPVRGTNTDEKQRRHGAPYGPTMTLRFRHAAQGVRQAARDCKNQDHLEKICERSRIFVWVSAIRIKETATVCAEHLDDFLRCSWAGCNHLLCNGLRNRLAVRPLSLDDLRFDELCRGIRLQVLDHPLRNQHQ
jgi:hypothetical protein